MSQLSKGTTFQDTVLPGANVNATRLNAHVDNAVLLNGAVTDQNERTTTLAADTVLLGDSTQPSTSTPLKVQMQNLLLQSQRDGTQRWGGVASGVNTLAVTTTPASSGIYQAGETIRFQTGGSPNSGAVTLNIDGRGAKNLYSSAPAALIAGDLPANSAVEAIYDGTVFQIVGLGAVNSHLCGENLRGDTQQYAATSGTNSYSISPLDSSGVATFTALYTGMTIKFKVNNTNTGTCTLVVGTQPAVNLVSPIGLPLLPGALQAGQIVTAVFDGAKFVMTSPICGWDYVATAGATLANGITDFAHNLPAKPSRVQVTLLCSTAQSPWVANDELPATNVAHPQGDPEINWWVDATNGRVRVAIADRTSLAATSASGVKTTLTYTSWTVKVYASL